MDLSVLSPEEIDTLKKALDQYQNVAPTSEHADMESDKEFLNPIIEAIELLMQAVETISDKLDTLEKVVMDDIIGGVKELHDGNVRSMNISNVRDKYSSVFDPLESSWKDEGDIYEKIFDKIEELKGLADYSEEMEGAEVNNIAEMLQKKVDVNPSTSNDPVAEVEESSEEPDKLQQMMAQIKRQKEKSKGLSIF